MSWLQRLWRRYRLLVHRDAAERSMDDEFRHHIESEIADRIRSGTGAAEATRTALRDFGSIEAVKEEARDARGLRWVEDLILDVSAGGQLPDTAEATLVLRPTERVRELPAVRAAGLISGRPLGGFGPGTTVRDAASAPPTHAQDPVVDVRFVDSGLFRALGVPLTRGVLFDRHDADERFPPVVISTSLARGLWGDGDPVGRELAMHLYGGIVGRVTGSVGDIHSRDVRTPARPTAYLSALRFPTEIQDLVVRTDGPPDAIVPVLRAVVRSLDASLPLYDVVTLPGLVHQSLARDRLVVLLLAGFAVVALLLAATGVFGVFAGEVTRRRKEIGIRLALGARESRVITMVLLAASRRAVTGIAAGALLAAIIGRVMQSLLFGVRPTDPISFVGVAAIVLGIALTATLVPTWQALRTQPLTSLRED